MDARWVRSLFIYMFTMLVVSACSGSSNKNNISIGVYLKNSNCSAEEVNCPDRKTMNLLEKMLEESDLVQEFEFINSVDSGKKFTEFNADNPIILELAGDSFSEYFHVYIEPEFENEFRNQFDGLAGVDQVAYVIY